MEIISHFQEMWRIALQGKTQGVWFLAAIYALVVCVYSLSFQIRTRYWPFVPGELVEFEVARFGATNWVKSDQEYVSKALYKYTVSSVGYDGTRISPWIFVASHNARFVLKKHMSSIQRLPGGKVKVFHDPNNPKKSFLTIAGKVGIFVTLIISVIPLLAYYVRYHV